MWCFLRKIINKIKTIYRVGLFREYTSNPHKNIRIYGTMTLINKNIVCGNNVLFYPNVMLFGDGFIDETAIAVGIPAKTMKYRG